MVPAVLLAPSGILLVLSYFAVSCLLISDELVGALPIHSVWHIFLKVFLLMCGNGDGMLIYLETLFYEDNSTLLQRQ